MKLGKAKSGKNRRLKVYPKYRFTKSKSKVVPEIRLCGKWLRDVGFQSGNFIEITSEMNKITITTTEKDDKGDSSDNNASF